MTLPDGARAIGKRRVGAVPPSLRRGVGDIVSDALPKPDLGRAAMAFPRMRAAARSPRQGARVGDRGRDRLRAVSIRIGRLALRDAQAWPESARVGQAIGRSRRAAADPTIAWLKAGY